VRDLNIDRSSARVFFLIHRVILKLVSSTMVPWGSLLTSTANQQCCESVRGGGEPRDMRALSLIMIKLIQKYIKDDGAIGVDNLARWPFDYDAVTFLLYTTSAMSIRELQNICGLLL
jgi:hypothetical protein